MEIDEQVSQQGTQNINAIVDLYLLPDTRYNVKMNTRILVFWL